MEALTTEWRSRVGIAFCEQPNGVRDVQRAVAAAELVGFESAWFSEDLWTRKDGFVFLTAAALASDRIRLGTGIATPYSHRPIQLAMTFNTLAEIAPDRLVFGIGAGGPWSGVFRDLISQTPPLRAIRECIAEFRALAGGGAISSGGSTISLTVDRPCFEAMPQSLAPTPVYIGAHGPLLTKLAGEIADGLILGTSARLDEIGRSLGYLSVGANRVGRTASSIDVAAIMVTSVSDNGQIEPNVLCKVANEIGRLEDDDIATLDLDPDRTRWVREAMRIGDCSHAFAALDQKMISTFVTAGKPDDCLDRIKRFVAAGVRLPILLPFGRSIQPILELGRAYLSLQHQ